MNNADAIVYLRQFDAGKSYCKATHGALADRWQEIGRQGCEATHSRLIRQYRFEAEEQAYQVGRRGRARGRREGVLAGLGVALALAVVAGALGRRWGR